MEKTIFKQREESVSSHSEAIASLVHTCNENHKLVLRHKMYRYFMWIWIHWL